MDRKIDKKNVRELFCMDKEEFEANWKTLSSEERERVNILNQRDISGRFKAGRGIV